MPLIMGKSPKSEAQGGKVCAAHGMQDCGHCMSKGGDFEHEEKMSGYEKMPMAQKYAEGGFVREEKESGYEDMPKARKSHEYPHEVENQDLVARAMDALHMARGGMYSEGGKVANDTPDMADFEENDFDDLPKEDDLSFHYTGESSGDEDGDEQEDDDRHDIVERIMRSRKKKDRMPHPA